mgnify:CR=1 FL=1
MKIHEYQAKEIFAKFGIPVPNGKMVEKAGDAKGVAEEIGKKVVVKAQVHVGGRGKAGGVKLAADPAEAERQLGGGAGSGPARRRELHLGCAGERIESFCRHQDPEWMLPHWPDQDLPQTGDGPLARPGILGLPGDPDRQY